MNYLEYKHEGKYIWNRLDAFSRFAWHYDSILATDNIKQKIEQSLLCIWLEIQLLFVGKYKIF